MLNPDSKSLVENQDLCLGFFFSITKHLFLFVRTKNIIGLWNSLLFIIRFVIYKRTQYTYLQNGPFDAIRFSWQANYRKQGFLQTVRVFDLRAMELCVELRLSFFFCFIVRSLGEIEGKSMMASSSFSPPLDDVYILILTSLIIKTTVRSTRRSSKRSTCRKSSLRRPSLRPPPPRCSHRYVSFFFAFWSCFEGGFKRG